jgi:hypothetical protein
MKSNLISHRFIAKLTCLIICLAFFKNAAAQNDTTDSYVKKNTPSDELKKKTFKQRLHGGGSAGASFGITTYVELSPRIAYQATEKIYVGGGINYMYFSTRSGNVKYSTSIYGPNVFAQYMITGGLFGYGEFNAFSLEPNYGYNNDRIWIGSAPVGLGFYSGGQFGGIYLSVLYDLIGNPYSPYKMGDLPVIFRIGILL